METYPVHIILVELRTTYYFQIFSRSNMSMMFDNLPGFCKESIPRDWHMTDDEVILVMETVRY